MGCCSGRETFDNKRPTFHVANSAYISATPSKLRASRDTQKFNGLTAEGKTSQDLPGVIEGEEETEINIEENDHSACPFVRDDYDGKVSIPSERADGVPRHLELSVTQHTISGHVQSPEIDSTKPVIEYADLSDRIAISPSSMISIDPDNERGDLEEAKLKIKERDKKIQELLSLNEKLKSTGRKQSYKRRSLHDSPSYLKRLSSFHETPRGSKKPQGPLSLQAHMKDIKKELFASSSSMTGYVPINESIVESPGSPESDPESLKCDITSPDIFSEPLKFALSVEEVKVKRQRTIDAPTVQEHDNKWEISDLVLL